MVRTAYLLTQLTQFLWQSIENIANSVIDEVIVMTQFLCPEMLKVAKVTSANYVCGTGWRQFVV